MTVHDAFEITSRWVAEHRASFTGFRGAFLHGSVCYRNTDEEIATHSDIDVILVCDTRAPRTDARCLQAGAPWPAPSGHVLSGKTECDGLHLDISYLPYGALASPEDVLANHVLAGSIARGLILSDVDGWLQSLHESVGDRFRRPEWIRARCGSALRKSENTLRSVDDHREQYDQALSLLFGLGMQTHVLLVAACENPTVRSRYEAVGRLLKRRGLAEVHEYLLGLLGSDRTKPERTRFFLDAMSRAYDRATDVPNASPRYTNHVNPYSRHAAVEGSRLSIDCGQHREAMFWIGSCFAKALGILHDGLSPDRCEEHATPFGELLGELGIETEEKRRERRTKALAFVRRLRDITEELLLGYP